MDTIVGREVDHRTQKCQTTEACETLDKHWVTSCVIGSIEINSTGCICLIIENGTTSAGNHLRYLSARRTAIQILDQCE